MTDLRAQFAALRPPRGFRVILADPATRFDTRSPKGEDRSPQAHYDTMTIEQIAAMPVEVLAAKDCALFLWTVWPLMPRWMEIVDAWDFRYSGLAWEWIKYNPETGKYAFGPGYGSRKNVEPCLLCTRGSPSLRQDTSFFGQDFAAEGVHSVRDFIEWNPLDAIRSPRREHSRKPPEQYERIETLFDGPYVELFNRHRRSGWTCWGNQSNTFGEA
jgi:N6-adenosine-specific RNA methylase IME4